MVEMDEQSYRVAMVFYSHITALFILFILISPIDADECYYKACEKTGMMKTKCQFTIGCRMEQKFAKCNISGMAIDKTPPLQKGSTCIDPIMVPGFKDFCAELLYDFNLSQPAPAYEQNDDKTEDSDTDIIRESKVAAVDNCIGTTILVSIATGCFLAGGFSMWIIMFCCKLSTCCGSRRKEAAITSDENNSSNWNPSIHDRPIGSTSSAQLLGNASVESMNTNNTLLSNGDSPPSRDVSTLGRSTNPSLIGFQTSQNRFEGQQFRHTRTPSAAWAENRNALLSSTRAQTAQWNVPRQSTLPNIPSQTCSWSRSGVATLPNFQASSVPWNNKGLPGFIAEQSTSAPWLDTIYSPASEGSSRDYQSIKCGSDNPYAPCSESSSDYSAPHRVMVIRDGEIYQASSESSGSNNDYTSLKGQRFSRPNDSIYYPTSEGSNKDYASLLNEKDAYETTENPENISDDTNWVEKKENEDNSHNKSFNVSGLTFPIQASCRSNFGWTSNLEEIHEYETVDSARKDEGGGNNGSVATIADLCNDNQRAETSVQPHEYFKLEPLQSENN